MTANDSGNDLYIDLIKRSLLNVTYAENEVRIRYLMALLEKQPGISHKLDYKRLFQIEDDTIGAATMRAIERVGIDGRDPRPFAQAMMGRQRLDHLEFCVRTIIQERIPGDLMECGVWKGAGCILMRAMMKSLGELRHVWAADSFQGVPASSAPQDAGLDLTGGTLPWLSVSLPRVKDLFRRYGLLDDGVTFVQGWFDETLSKCGVEKLALLRIDGDLYSSTMDVLTSMYDNVVVGGFIIIDDYGDIAQCRQAVDEFRGDRGIRSEIIPIDWAGVYWRKTLADLPAT